MLAVWSSPLVFAAVLHMIDPHGVAVGNLVWTFIVLAAVPGILQVGALSIDLAVHCRSKRSLENAQGSGVDSPNESKNNQQ
jgi:hypothetical protein